MMEGRIREYNWRDITRLIYADMGLKTEGDQRSRGEIWCVGGFVPPEHEKDTVIRVHAYDKPFSDRIREHGGN